MGATHFLDKLASSFAETLQFAISINLTACASSFASLWINHHSILLRTYRDQEYQMPTRWSVASSVKDGILKIDAKNRASILEGILAILSTWSAPKKSGLDFIDSSSKINVAVLNYLRKDRVETKIDAFALPLYWFYDTH